MAGASIALLTPFLVLSTMLLGRQLIVLANGLSILSSWLVCSDLGRIAASHGWSLDRVADAFPRFEHDAIGAPIDCPGEWTVDPLKLACLLRSRSHSGESWLEPRSRC